MTFEGETRIPNVSARFHTGKGFLNALCFCDEGRPAEVEQTGSKLAKSNGLAALAATDCAASKRGPVCLAPLACHSQADFHPFPSATRVAPIVDRRARP